MLAAHPINLTSRTIGVVCPAVVRSWNNQVTVSGQRSFPHLGTDTDDETEDRRQDQGRVAKPLMGSLDLAPRSDLET